MFYLREYPKVVGLLHGLLGSRLVAEELAQVDAAGRLREIVRRTDQPVTHGRTAVLLDQPWEPELAEASLVPPAPPRRGPQRLALVVNLLLVLGIGVLLGGAASYVLDTDGAAPPRRPTPLPPRRPAPSPPDPPGPGVPAACLDAAELADEVISRLNRNERGNRLAAALREYTIASQDCRRAATP